MIFVSKCLCGINCKYNGENNNREEIKKLVKQERTVLICPEELGGLPVPRLPSEIEEGYGGEEVLDGKAKVIDVQGKDVTENFRKGAEETLELAKKFNPQCIYLKQGSPSCGCGRIYTGRFDGTKKEGNGVTAALLKRAGFRLVDVD